MGIDQAGQHRGVRKINDARVRRNGRGSVAYRLNAIAANHDDLIAAWLVARAIDERTGADHSDLRRRQGLRRLRLERDANQEQTKRDAKLHERCS